MVASPEPPWSLQPPSPQLNRSKKAGAPDFVSHRFKSACSHQTLGFTLIGRHHGLSGHEYEQTLGDGEGQGSLVCCSPWGHKESDTTECLLLLLLSRFSRVRLCATP